MKDYGDVEESGAEPVQIAAPRIPVVGDLIAIPHAGTFFGPFAIHTVTDTSIEVVTRTATMMWYTQKLSWPEGDVEPELSKFFDDRNDITVLQNYGADWVFADDPIVRYQTDLERQVLGAKLMRLANSANPWSVNLGTSAPVCSECAKWPCAKLATCPDYLRIADGLIWLPAEHRFMELTEQAAVMKCGDRKVVAAPTMKERVLETMKPKTKRAA